MTNPKNPDLYQALKEYFKAACVYLSNKYKSIEDLIWDREDVPSWQVYDSFRFPPPEEFLKIEGLYKLLDSKYRKHFEQKGEYKNVIEIMKKDKDIKKYFNAFVEIPEPMAIVEVPDAEECLEWALTHFLKKLSEKKLSDRRSSLEFDESTFDEFYKEVENFFYEDKIQYRCLAPLYNFQIMGEKRNIPLEKPNLSITKIRSEQLLRTIPVGSVGELSWSKGEDKWAIEYRYEAHKKLSENNPLIKARVISSQTPEESESLSRKAIEEFDKVCSALRLFKRGVLGYHYMLHAPGSWTPSSPFGNSVKEQELAVLTPYWGEKYILQEDEAEKFRKFWVWFKKARQAQRKRIELALRRFNFGYQRETLDDKLIDWMIAFEALLLNERGELSYRLALRASRLLGRDPNERKEIFDFLHEAYKQRSGIVHGGEVKISRLKKLKDFKDLKDFEIFEAFVSKVEDYLRSAIIEFMKRVEDRTEDHVLRDLDDQIARGDCSIPPNQDEEG